MKKFFYSVKFQIFAAVCASLILGVFIAAVSGNGSSPLSSAFSFLMKPLGSVSEYITRSLGDFSAGFVSSSAYRDEIASLRSEIDDYKAQLVDYEKLKHKLQAYEAFLEVKDENPDYTFMPASVIFRDASDIYFSFTVNKGSADGIKPDMPVICGRHLVGITGEVSEKTTVVLSLYDPAVSVSSYEIRTREDCYTESDAGLLQEGLIKLSGLSRSTPIVSGGIICSSGIGGLYPADLLIGTVTKVENSETDISAFAAVKPGVDIAGITDVFIITGYDADKP